MTHHAKPQTWLPTQEGPVDLLHPDADCINLRTLATVLGRLPRYNGHTLDFYSVAEHCVLMASHLEGMGASPADVLRALLHDAHEAYLGDMTQPVQHAYATLLGDDFTVARETLESRVDKAIAQHFEVEHLLPFRNAVVAEADVGIFFDEAAALFLPSGQPWRPQGARPLGVILRRWSPIPARQAWWSYVLSLQAKVRR